MSPFLRDPTLIWMAEVGRHPPKGRRGSAATYSSALESDRPPFRVWKGRQDPKGRRHWRIQVIAPPSPPVVITFKSWAARVPQTQVGLGSSARLAVTVSLSHGASNRGLAPLSTSPFPRSPTLPSSVTSPPSLAGGLGVAWHNPSGSMPPERVGKSREAPRAGRITKPGIGAPVLGLLTPRSRWAGRLGPLSCLSLPGSMNLACHSMLLAAVVTAGPPSPGEVTAESHLPCLACVRVCGRSRREGAPLFCTQVIYCVCLTTSI